MNIKYEYDWQQPMALIRCHADDLIDNGDGTYSFVDPDVASNAQIGMGSEIIVIDIPGKLLFWDADTQLAYDWTGEGGGGDSNLVGSAIVGTSKAG